MVINLDICNFLWFFALIYSCVYIIALIIVTRLNRCRFNRTNKAVLVTYSLIFSVTVAGSSINIIAQ